MAAKKRVAKRGGGLPAVDQERLNARRERIVNREQQTVGKQLAIKGGTFKFSGEDLGDTLEVVILDYVFVNQYFATAYNENKITPPVCFALADNELELTPTDESPDKQSETCEGCWANEWESGDGDGPAKACQNRRRVAVINAEWLDDPESLKSENVAYLSLGGKTLDAWRTYINKVGKSLKADPIEVITRLSFDQSVSYEKLEFHTLGKVDDGVIPALLDLAEETADELRAAPNFREEEEVEAKPQRKRAAKKKPAAKKRSAKKAPASKRRSKFA